MAIKMKRVIALLFAAVLAVSCTFSSSAAASVTDGGADEKRMATSENTAVSMDGYEQIAESDSWIMYFYEPTLSIMLENKQTGEILESTLSEEKDDGTSNTSWNAYMKSGIVITAIIGTTNTYQVDLITCENTRDVTITDNGFSAKIYFKDYGFGLTLNVSLEGDELVVNVPDDSIIEEKADNYISTISLYPFMGYTYLDDEDGYMLIPDGNGALIYLDNKENRFTTGFSQMIYGKDAGFTDSTTSTLLWDEIEMVDDANQVIAPVFGMAHTSQGIGYLAVVEAGEKRASIEAHPNGVMVEYNRCFAKFLLRDIYVQPLNNSNSGTVTSVEADRTHSDLQVRYLLLDGDDADYSGMAVAYRNYLLDNDLVSVKDNSYNTRIDFLGTDREEFLMGTKAVTVTTTDNIEEMYGELQEAGVESVLSVYKGWQKGGVYNLPITKYSAASAIGGKSSLTKLIESEVANDYKLYLYDDALRTNPTTNSLTFNVAKKVNKRTITEEIWAQVYDTFYYLTPTKTLSNVQSLVQSCVKSGADYIALGGITDSLFSYSFKGSYYTRNDTADSYEAAVASADETAELILEQPFAYLWEYTDAFLDMPLGSSDYI